MSSSAAICTCFIAFSDNVGKTPPPTIVPPPPPPPPRTGSIFTATEGCSNKLTCSAPPPTIPPPLIGTIGAGTGGWGNRLSFGFNIPSSTPLENQRLKKYQRVAK